MSALAPRMYDIACPCGGRLSGQRQAQHQVVRCPACGESRFILPHSPLPEPLADRPSQRRRWPWLIATVAALLVLAVGVTLAVVYSRPDAPAAGPIEPPPSEARLQELAADGQTALSEGAYLRAA